MATKMARLVTIGAVAAATAVGSPAWAHDGGHERHRTPEFDVINQVSDQALKQDSRRPALVDPDAVNTWGLALGPDTPLWVANNGTDTATVYSGGADGERVDKVNLTVSVPGGPTGAVFNDTDGFAVPDGGGDAPARFIFVTESGDVIAWNQNAGTKGVVVAHEDGAIYKGATLLQTHFGNFLLAADFHNARIDVFDEDFDKVNLPDRRFQDPDLPEGFAPFNVFAVGERVYVTYAKQDEAAEDDVPGVGLGFVDLFTGFGRHVERVASRGTLNAPWGVAIAPKSFGRFAGDLLVGNFGDGKINVFDRDGEFEGLLRDDDGDVITIDGLWALLPGTEQTGGEGTLWFSSGPDDEQHGLVGQLIRAN